MSGNPNIRFYVGAPLQTRPGSAIGTLCVIDSVPRDLSDAQREALTTLSQAVATQLNLRRHLKSSIGYLEAFERNLPSPIWVKNQSGEVILANAAMLALNGRDARALKEKTDFDLWPESIPRRMSASDEAVLNTNKAIKSVESSDEDAMHWLVYKFPMEVAIRIT